jgi:predicted RNase H-like nuclease (RuvC/YqgF family)
MQQSCFKNHVGISFEVEECPLCTISESLRPHIKQFEEDIYNLKMENRVLKATIANLERSIEDPNHYKVLYDSLSFESEQTIKSLRSKISNLEEENDMLNTGIKDIGKERDQFSRWLLDIDPYFFKTL